jgi:hypothetical protein
METNTPMALQLQVIAENRSAHATWIAELKKALKDVPDLEFSEYGSDDSQVVFIDGKMKDLDGTLKSIHRGGKALFLLVKDGASVPEALESGLVDDVLVHPFRELEVVGKLRQYQQVLMWEEVSRMNTSFSDLIQQLHEDLKLAERLQKAKLPLRFPDIKGFDVTSRYLAGLKSGGDHFDLAESQDGQRLSVILTDSSSYGLCSGVLAALMRVTMRLSVDETRSCLSTVRQIHGELLTTLAEKDQLSLFYGVISRKDLKLRYLSLGSCSAFLARKGSKFQELPGQGTALSKFSGLTAKQDGEIPLQPQDRLIVVSDGFIEVSGGPEKACALFDRFRDRETKDVLNELVFSIKSKFKDPEDMPEQDCTAVIFDVDSNVIRLARD